MQLRLKLAAPLFCLDLCGYTASCSTVSAEAAIGTKNRDAAHLAPEGFSVRSGFFESEHKIPKRPARLECCRVLTPALRVDRCVAVLVAALSKGGLCRSSRDLLKIVGDMG